jgi:hypothetical protein
LAIKIISPGHGGIFRTGDGVPWVRTLNHILTDDNGNPNKLESIQDLRAYYEAHPEVRPKESHPAFPSSYGDIERPDPAQAAKARKKEGEKLIRKMRSITVGQP